MSAVEPDDVSPWTRDDWTGTEAPHLDALTAPDVPHARMHIDTAEWLTAIDDPAAPASR